MRVVVVLHFCDDCGAEFPEGTYSNKRYCDACCDTRTRDANQRYAKTEWRREYKRRWQQEWRTQRRGIAS